MVWASALEACIWEFCRLTHQRVQCQSPVPRATSQNCSCLLLGCQTCLPNGLSIPQVQTIGYSFCSYERACSTFWDVSFHSQQWIFSDLRGWSLCSSSSGEYGLMEYESDAVWTRLWQCSCIGLRWAVVILPCNAKLMLGTQSETCGVYKLKEWDLLRHQNVKDTCLLIEAKASDWKQILVP